MLAASLPGVVKEQNGGRGWSHARRACASKAVCAHMHTRAGMYVLQWREESREDRAKAPAPLPHPCSMFYLPLPHLLSPPPLPPCRSGCVQAGGVPYHIHCIGSRGLEAFMRRKASQPRTGATESTVSLWRIHTEQIAVKRFSFAKEIFVWMSGGGGRNS